MQKTSVSTDVVYNYRILKPHDAILINGAAECLAETFAGTIIDSVAISEPITVELGITTELVYEFFKGFITAIVDQGLCCVAIEPITGRVVGADVRENFNPEQEIPVLDGKLVVFEPIINLLGELEHSFVEAMQAKTGLRVEKNEFVHSMAIGVRKAFSKKAIAIKLNEILETVAIGKKYKGSFLEATNFRSQKLAREFWGYAPFFDINNNPIVFTYSTHPRLKNIPRESATDCQLLFKSLQG
jgi:hypothetical protein